MRVPGTHGVPGGACACMHAVRCSVDSRTTPQRTTSSSTDRDRVWIVFRTHAFAAATCTLRCGSRPYLCVATPAAATTAATATSHAAAPSVRLGVCAAVGLVVLRGLVPRASCADAAPAASPASTSSWPSSSLILATLHSECSVVTYGALHLETVLTFQPKVREIFKRYQVSLLRRFVESTVGG